MGYKLTLSFGKHEIDVIDFLRFFIKQHQKEFDRLLVDYMWKSKRF